MLEPAITLTDYILAAECAAVCVLLLRGNLNGFAVSFVLMFAGIGTAALCGGTVHGWFPDSESVPYKVLWRVTLLGIGVMALAGWRIGASLLFPERGARLVHKIALLEFGLYALFVIFVSQDFMVTIVNYLPAALFLLVALALHYRKRPLRPVMLGIVALIMTFASSGVQQAKISLHPVYLDHNVLYHLIQFAAIILLYFTAKHFAAKGTAA